MIDRQLDSLPVGYLQINPLGDIQDFNRSIQSMVGYEPEELRGMQFECLLPFAGRVMFHTFILPSLQQDSHCEEITINLRAKSGQEIPVQLNGALSHQNGVDAYNLIVVKTSRRLDYERKLKLLKDEQELINAELRKVIDSIPALIWSSASEGMDVFFNKNWLEFTGFTLEQAQGRGWLSAVHPEDVPHARSSWQQAIHPVFHPL